MAEATETTESAETEEQSLEERVSDEPIDAKPEHKEEKTSRYDAKTERPSRYEAKKYEKAEYKQESRTQGVRTIHGAVAIIYNPETGEFYLERNKTDYALKKEAGKVRFIGGTYDTTDEDTLETLVRELDEEVKSKKAKSILTRILSETQHRYTTIVDNVDGEFAHTDVYVIPVQSKSEWEAIKSSGLTHDAGPAVVMTLNEVLRSKSSDWAFGHDKVIARFVSEQYLGTTGYGSKAHHYQIPQTTYNPLAQYHLKKAA